MPHNYLLLIALLQVMKPLGQFLMKRVFSNFALSSKSSKAMNSKGIIAVCQMTSTDNKTENLEICSNLISSAKRLNAQVGC